MATVEVYEVEGVTGVVVVEAKTEELLESRVELEGSCVERRTEGATTGEGVRGGC